MRRKRKTLKATKKRKLSQPYSMWKLEERSNVMTVGIEDINKIQTQLVVGRSRQFR